MMHYRTCNSFLPFSISRILFYLLLVLITIAIIFYITRFIYKAKPKENLALTILKERFARGEIDENEYKMKRQYLNEK